MFLDSMRTKVHGKGMRIVYPDGLDERTLRAAEILTGGGWCQPILLGNEAEIRTKGKALALDFAQIAVQEPACAPEFARYVERYYELRKHKGMTMETAAEKVRLPNYFGCLMVEDGAADGMVSGLSSETKPFVPAFEIVKLKPGFRRASSLFALEWPERLLFFADCAVNIDPDAQTLADIAHATAQTVRSFGYEPRIAFLSFSTHDSAKGPAVEKIKEATALARKDLPDCVIDGEMQFDAALLPEVAEKKAPNSPFVAKGANVFIFPDLNCGNIAYKISERLGRATATGPILQGLNRPINDVSRGCSEQDLANVSILTAALATMTNDRWGRRDRCTISAF